jgi:cell division septation protein DedD
MADYEEAGYYELQLNNKQLVFFFMAAVAIAVVVFLCGVMVGRGVRDATIAAAGTQITASSGLSAAAEPDLTAAEVRSELDYQKRLESPQVDDRLDGESSSPEKLVADAKKVQSGTTPKAATSTKPKSEPKPAPPPEKLPASTGRRSASTQSMGSAQGTFTIQVVALKTRGDADKLVNRLATKGYRAYLEEGGASGLYRVRVGRFADRSEAERITQRLRDVEKFKPYITQ